MLSIHHFFLLNTPFSRNPGICTNHKYYLWHNLKKITSKANDVILESKRTLCVCDSWSLHTLKPKKRKVRFWYLLTVLSRENVKCPTRPLLACDIQTHPMTANISLMHQNHSNSAYWPVGPSSFAQQYCQYSHKVVPVHFRLLWVTLNYNLLPIALAVNYLGVNGSIQFQPFGHCNITGVIYKFHSNMYL